LNKQSLIRYTRISRLRQWCLWIRSDLGCIHWCKR